MTVKATQASCNSVLVSWSPSGTVSGIRRSDSLSSNTFALSTTHNSWTDQQVPCKHAYTYTVLFQNGTSIGPSSPVEIWMCCATKNSTYLIGIPQKTPESEIDSFALLVPLGDRVLEYLHDPGEIIEGPWRRSHVLELFPDQAIADTSLSLIHSSLGTLEAIVRVASPGSDGNDSLVGYEFRPRTGWKGPFVIKADNGPLSGVTGSQALIQSDRNNQDQFELLVPSKSEVLHYTHSIRRIANQPWRLISKLPPLEDKLQFTAISLLQSSPSELAAIARISPSNVLQGYVCNQENIWQEPFEVKSDQGPIDTVTGSPAFIQSGEHTFELVVPRKSKLYHYQLENQNFQQGIWRLIATLDPPNGDDRIQAVSLSVAFNTLGHLELAARERPAQGEGDDFMVGYIFDHEANAWKGPFDLLDENGQRIIAKDAQSSDPKLDEPD